jgi:uncharacterized membrane protein YgcG
MSIIRTLACALLVLAAASGPAAAVERILLFVSDVVVERSGDLAVTETIRVQAEGVTIRRGILRDFPTVYTRPDGTRVEVGFKVESVTRDGVSETWATEGRENGVRLRIGSADRTLAPGPREYVIKYRTTRQVGFFPNYDELYWNATGTGWTFAIEQAEARITLPANVPFRQSAFYTGPQGARGQDARIVEQQPGRIVFRTTRPLPANNSLTVGVAWEKGIVAPPTSAQLAGYWLTDNVALVIAIVGLALILAYYALAWLLVGRDPPSGTIIPLFGPPKEMSPAAARYLDRMGFDDRCFAVSIINLGVKGHLKLDEIGKTSIVSPRDGGQAIANEERAMASKLFASGGAVELVQANHETLGKAKDALNEVLKATYSGTLFRSNYGWSALGLILVLALWFASVAAIFSLNNKDLIAGILFGTLFSMPAIMIGGAMAFSGWQRMLGGGGWVIGGLVIIALAAAGGLFVVWYNSGKSAHLAQVIALYIAAAVAGLGFYWLKSPSPAGRRTMDDIEGFRQYLGVAEEDRLNALNPPEKTPALFERFLPYAVALDVQNEWAKRFAGVLAVAGAAAVAQSWYSGDRNWSDDPASFADHVGGELSSSIASASTAPGSSDSGGSSGGGSSGGGGGGGGGSGW